MSDCNPKSNDTADQPPAKVADTRRVIDLFNLKAEADRFFDDSSLAQGVAPQFVLILGPVATGKTRFRRQKYEQGYVVVDAADVFINLSRGRYVDFPSGLEGTMDTIGATVARRAVRERRHIVTEIIGHEYGPTCQLIDAMLAIGYKIDVVYIHKDVAEAWKWNLSRSDSNISAYYTEPFHRKWLLDAAAEAK